jgi:hypothetical protein
MSGGGGGGIAADDSTMATAGDGDGDDPNPRMSLLYNYAYMNLWIPRRYDVCKWGCDHNKRNFQLLFRTFRRPQSRFCRDECTVFERP